MRTTYDREAVDQLARAVLAGRALNEGAGIDARTELEQFDMVARAFHSDARPGRRAGSRRREPLGFGVEGLTAAVTALVLAVAVETLSKLAQERTDRSANRLASWVRRVILRRPEPTAEPPAEPSSASGAGSDPRSGSGRTAGSSEDGPALTPVQMQLIHRAARRHARRMNVPEQTAEAVADGIVAELAMAGAATLDPAADGGARGAGPGANHAADPGAGPAAHPGTRPAADSGRRGSGGSGSGGSGSGGSGSGAGGTLGGGPGRGEPAA